VIPREEWPDPKGERPSDWPAHYWQAFQLMETEGISAKDAAIRIGRSGGSLSNFMRKQRMKYGVEFWPPTRKPGWQSIGPHAGSAVAVQRAAWPELRALASLGFGEAAETARRACVVALESLLNDPVRLKLLAPRDILDLAKAAELLARRADLLSGIVPTSQPLPNPLEPAGYPVDLGNLGQVTPDHHRDVIEMASLVVAQYKEERKLSA